MSFSLLNFPIYIQRLVESLLWIKPGKKKRTFLIYPRIECANKRGEDCGQQSIGSAYSVYGTFDGGAAEERTIKI